MDVEAKAEVSLEGLGMLFLFPSKAVSRLCLITACAQALCISPMLPFHSAEAVTVSVRDRQASGRAFST